jgi:NADH:ubiquinone oxidoreductase subunit E
MTNKDKSDLVLEELEITENNKEILELKEIYDLMKNILIIKNSFEKENYLKEHNIEFYNVIKGIKTRYIKEVCTSFQGFFHFKNGAYNLR